MLKTYSSGFAAEWYNREKKKWEKFSNQRCIIYKNTEEYFFYFFLQNVCGCRILIWTSLSTQGKWKANIKERERKGTRSE